MITYNDIGVITPDRNLTEEDCFEYLSSKYGKNNGTINNVELCGMKIKIDVYGDFEYKYEASIIFMFAERKIQIHYHKVFYVTNEEITRVIDCTNPPFSRGYEFYESIFSISNALREYNFKCDSIDTLNDAIICIQYMTSLNQEVITAYNKKMSELSLAELMKIPEPICENISDSYEYKEANEEKTEKENKEISQVIYISPEAKKSEDREKQIEELLYQNDEQAQIQQPVTNLEKTTPEQFFDNHRCSKCGNIGHWKDIYRNESNFVHAQCTICEHYECTYMNDDGTENTQKRDSLRREIEEDNRREGNNYLNQPAPWETQYLNHPCPYCGAYKVRYSKWDDKAMHTAFWGVFSRKLHSNFICDACKEMWS